ncbi:hypothetical protein ABH973_000526 [Bradyrhizobium ottawaense]
MRQGEHLDEIGQRALAAVVLPVGVGDEGDRGVEGKILSDRALSGRIEGQHGLKPHHAVDDEEAADMEQQHGDRVGQPMLLALLVDAGDPVYAGLDRAQHRRQERPLAVEYARHVPAERLGQRNNNGAKQNDLEPTDHSHGINPSGLVQSFRLFARNSGRSTVSRQATSTASASSNSTSSSTGQNRSGRSSA